MKLYLTYNESRTGGEPLSDEPWSDREDEDIEFTLKDALIESTSWCESVDVDFEPKRGDTVYIVLVRFSTGDTFGHTSGAWYIEGAYEDKKKAYKIVKQIKRDKYKSYKPWDGYFERLESATVEYRQIMD